MQLRLASIAMILCLSTGLFAQSDIWTKVPEPAANSIDDNSRLKPAKYLTLSLEGKELLKLLHDAPHEREMSSNRSTAVISIPMPDGTMQEFSYVAYDAIEPSALRRMPRLQAYKGVSTTTGDEIRFDYGYMGFNAYIMSADGDVYVERYYDQNDDYYVSYYGSELWGDQDPADALKCELDDATAAAYMEEHDHDHHHQQLLPSYPLRIYRLGVSTTGEWSVFKGGGTLEGTISAIMTVVNQLNGVMERDMTLRLVLVDGLDDAIFLDGNDDPYANGDPGDLLSKGTATLNQAVGPTAYDIGHVFGTNAGGLASLGSVCGNNRGAASSSTFGAYRGVGFFHIVAHEMGHQLTATHTFNWCEGENETGSTAYEPGSGSTIMSYAGASNCENRYIQDMSDAYFHTNSIQRAIVFMREGNGNNCGTNQSHDNTAPVAIANYADGFHIPISTPFKLTADHSDEEDDPVTYTWEQYDLGPLSQLGAPIGNAPLFRSLPPTDDPTRYFPALNTVLTGVRDVNETLPTSTRDITMRLTVRDNNADVPLVDFTEVAFNATASAGPFEVTAPRASEDLTAGGFYLVEWDVANTDNSIVNCQTVNILWASDARNFSETLKTDVLNTGAAYVKIPEGANTSARIMVEAADNIFYNVTDAVSAVEPSVASFDIAPLSIRENVCLPGDASFNFETTGLLGFSSEVTLEVVDGLPSGVTATWLTNPVPVGELAQLSLDFRDYTLEGDLELTVRATADGSDTIMRSVTVNTVNTDFSDIALQGPTDGTAGQSILPTFSWDPSPFAESYTVEIATSPRFRPEDIVRTESGITEASYVPRDNLEENTLYYWRVLGENRCLTGGPTAAYSFHTVSLSCADFKSNDGPINISASGRPSIESRIAVSTNSPVNDINIANINMLHEFISDIKVTAISPAGTEVVLFDQICGNRSNMDLGYDDESGEAFACDMTTGRLYPPLEPLATFLGEDAMGLWTLRVEDNNSGSGGRLNEWSLELCASISLQGPSLLLNDTLFLQARGEEDILSDILSAEDANNGADELIYTIVNDVQYGRIKRSGVDLGTGDTFTQADVDNGNVKYLSLEGGREFDSFDFVITDGEGGYIGGEQFNIAMDNLISTRDLDSADDLVRVSPNPSTGLILLQTEIDNQQGLEVSITDITGLEIAQYTDVRDTQRIDLSDAPSGVYLVIARTASAIQIEKVVIQH